MSDEDFERGESGESDGDSEEDEGEWEVDLLEGNERTLMLYASCQMTYNSAGMGAFADGISSQEVRSAVALHGIPESEWPRVVLDVQLMGRAAAKVMNKKKPKQPDQPRKAPGGNE